MIDELDELVESFRGHATRVRCFDHIMNLVVKTLLKQFDVMRKGKTTNDAALDEVEAALHELTDDLEPSAEDSDDGVEVWDMDAVNLDDDNVEGWVDEHDNMTEEEVAKLEVTTRPVKLVLAKVC